MQQIQHVVESEAVFKKSLFYQYVLFTYKVLTWATFKTQAGRMWLAGCSFPTPGIQYSELTITSTMWNLPSIGTF